MTTIVANIPARKIAKNGKVWATEAHTNTFEQDAQGRWALVDSDLGRIAVHESEVIDACRGATNWPEIKAAYFRMDGFHA